jgi:hypothetical protein
MFQEFRSNLPQLGHAPDPPSFRMARIVRPGITIGETAPQSSNVRSSTPKMSNESEKEEENQTESTDYCGGYPDESGMFGE